MTALQLARKCKRLALEKKAIDIDILELKGLTDIADYFVICSGDSNRQLKAIADNIRVTLKEKGVPIFHQNIDQDCTWIILDYVDVIVHIFDQETRGFYKLESLWGDAKRIK